MRLRFLFAFLLILTLSAAAYPDAANTAYKQGVRAESRKQYDQAFEFYKQAYTLKPEEPRYGTAYLRSRTFAAAQHVANGMKLRESLKLQEALTEFQRAAEIDGTNYVAAQGVRETSELVKKQAETGRPPALNPVSPLAKQVAALEGPIELEPSPNTPITLRMTTTADIIYRAIGKLGGINVLFDLDYKPQKVTVELNEVMVPEALKMLALESKTFWRPISPTAIFVAAEGKRKEYEANVMKTFFLRNASTPAELQEVVGTLKGMLELNRIQVNPTRSSITIRGTPDQLVLAEKLVSEADKAKSEVVLDVAVMEVSRTLINNWGTTVPTSTTITPVPAGGTTGSSTSPVVKIGSINGNNYVIPLPSATFTLLMSDSHTKVLQRPQVRALDNEKATLKIGDRIPIATGSFAPGIGAGGISPLVNTQFTYLDVGVNIDITPHIHSGRDVTLKMSLEISTHTGDVNIGGISQPTIGQRRVDQEARLQDGEVNLLAGILEDSETKSLSGYPWLTKIPILKYLFGQENKERQENEIVFAITPHVVRAEEINDDDLKVIDVGTSNSIGLRYKESKPPKAKEPPSPPANSTTQGGERRQPTTQKSTAPSAKAPAQSDR
ncbi:MAG: type II and III secretion system protein [Acidobacteria bacterium]|nr:MAG: type II and III secretion system protein [Acidobacteriota bacterium]